MFTHWLGPEKDRNILASNLSRPSFESVNSYIDSEFSSVKHSTFDHAISLIQRLRKGALIGKKI
jgi:hypothetical protein